MNLFPKQRRTVIIRGRGQTEMDTLLSVFASLVERNTPNSPDVFDEKMISELKSVFPKQENKTHRNYLTETIGQLFSMYFEDKGSIQISPLAMKLIRDGDQPSFFKVLITNLQFPNPMAKVNKYDFEVADGLGVRPLVLVLDLLRLASAAKDKISFTELAFFVLNSESALQGSQSAAELYETILESRLKKHELPTFSGSNARQHIKEALSLLILANFVRSDSEYYWINPLEEASIVDVCKFASESVLFRTRGQDEKHYDFQQSWKKHLTDYSNLPQSILETDVAALGPADPMVLVKRTGKRKANDIGREGELLVLQEENKALEKAFPGLGIKAMDFTSKRGIGFDIESRFYESGHLNGMPHRIEVKSTLRVTKPNVRETTVPDSFNLTRSEMIAVDTYLDTFSIYRVYIFAGGYHIHILRNPANLRQEKVVSFIPDTWIAQYVPSNLSEEHTLIEMVNA